jgi:signal transduction histidine kinase
LPGLNIYFSVFVYSPKQDYFVALFEDVTEQKRAEAEIRNKQELLKLTGEIGKIGGWEIDVVKGTSNWTEEVARIQDLDPSTPANVDYGYSFYTPASKPIIEKAVNEAINEGKPYDLELEIITAKKVRKLIRTTGLPEMVDGKVVKLAGIFQDITEIKKTEDEIKKLNDELEQRVKDRTAELLAANQELESFSYSVSHDLRAPIRAIDGFSQIILDDYGQGVHPDVMRYLEIIRQNTRNMGNLVDDLLAFSRLGKQSLERQTVNIRHLVEEVVEEIQQTLQGRKVEFVIGDLPDCQADVNLLRQVFVNLISNAVKFTRKCEHARVEISSELKSPPDNISVEKFTKYCYYVRDNGIGFDMRYYDKLFGVFQRLHKAEDYEGTGVGLAIVKRVIEKHGGKVWAESQLNQGTTFYFVLGEANDNGKTD